MKSHFLIMGALWLFSITGSAQIKNLHPFSIEPLTLSNEGEQAFNENLEACRKIWKKMDKGVKYQELNDNEKIALSNIDETETNYWSIEGDGCSWYCGGGPIEVTASSHLSSQGANQYLPSNAHDLNFKNAWVEGIKGYGIGEYLLYTFAPTSPRITEIKVVNGYVKSEQSWENNSRVKKLKVYQNDKPLAIFHLQDSRSTQTFRLGPLGNDPNVNRETLKKEQVWTLKFEILEVFEGKKYDDVVISEIYFDGMDVHCFAKGTLITMANGSLKEIENIEVGDEVVSLDPHTGQQISAKVEQLEKAIHHQMVTYIFASGRTITSTPDHPFYLINKGWASFDPGNSSVYQGFENVNKIERGDTFQISNGEEKLVEVQIENMHQETYTISRIDSGKSFLANGFIVGVESLKPGTKLKSLFFSE